MRQLFINKEHPNGIVVEVDEPIAPETSYAERVVSRIREIYSVDDELAILRQRDTKPEEFAAYNAFVENIKTEEKISER